MTASTPNLGRVLVAYSSKMGSTAEIAEAIGDELRKSGAEVDVSDARTAFPPLEYDAVVLGSGVYAGRWLKPARRYLKQNRRQLAGRPTWLFRAGRSAEVIRRPGRRPAARSSASRTSSASSRRSSSVATSILPVPR